MTKRDVVYGQSAMTIHTNDDAFPNFCKSKNIRILDVVLLRDWQKSSTEMSEWVLGKDGQHEWEDGYGIYRSIFQFESSSLPPDEWVWHVTYDIWKKSTVKSELVHPLKGSWMWRIDCAPIPDFRYVKSS